GPRSARFLTVRPGSVYPAPRGVYTGCLGGVPMAARTPRVSGGFDPGPWGSGGFANFHTRRYRLWHVRLSDTAYDVTVGGDTLTTFSPNGGRLIDVSWGIVICDRVSPRGTMHILDHVPQLR